MNTFRIDCDLAYEFPKPVDLIFHLRVAHNDAQTIVSEALDIDSKPEIDEFEDAQAQNRFFRFRAEPGKMRLRYRAVVRVKPQVIDPTLPEIQVGKLPPEVLHYLMPTRYCESDELLRLAMRSFGQCEPGHARVQAIVDWIKAEVEYVPGSTGPTTTATDILLSRAGVCRDFSHLGISLCRAMNIPARIVSAYAIFNDPQEEPDFHAIFEAYLGGRWVMFDATEMAALDRIVRIGTGRDAKDVAFATIFGAANMLSMKPQITLEAATKAG